MATKSLKYLSNDQIKICNERIKNIWNDNSLTREMIAVIAEGLLEMVRYH